MTTTTSGPKERVPNTHLDVEPVLDGGHVVHLRLEGGLLGCHPDGVDDEVVEEELRYHGAWEGRRDEEQDGERGS